MKNILNFLLVFTLLSNVAQALPFWAAVNEFTGSSDAERYVRLYDGAPGNKFQATNNEGGSIALNTVHDLAQDSKGTLWVFNGTFSPTLWEITPQGDQTLWSIPGWSIVNQTTRGGIAISGSYIFLTDNSTGTGESEMSGLIRVNTQSMTYERFGTLTQPSDISISGNTLYALEDNNNRVYEYDLETMSLLKIVTLSSASYYGIAVGGNGEIFATGYDYTLGKMIRKLSPQGETISSLYLNIGLGDIDIDKSGNIMTGTANTGEVLFTDISLQSYTTLKVAESPSGGTVAVAYAVPEPSTSAILLTGSAVIMRKLMKKK